MTIPLPWIPQGGGVIPRAVGGADCAKQGSVGGATDQRASAEQPARGGTCAVQKS